MRLFFALIIGLSIGALIDHITDYAVDRQFPEAAYSAHDIHALNALVGRLTMPKHGRHMTEAERNHAILELYAQEDGK